MNWGVAKAGSRNSTMRYQKREASSYRFRLSCFPNYKSGTREIRNRKHSGELRVVNKFEMGPPDGAGISNMAATILRDLRLAY